MVAPKHRKEKKRMRKSPGGRTTFKPKEEKPAKRLCALCGGELHGMSPKASKKTRKRPERVFGGVVCPQCVMILMKERTRMQAGFLKEQNVPLTHLYYIRALERK